MVDTAYCTTCGRTVYLAQGDARTCPVCSSALLPTERDRFEPDVAAARIAENEVLFRQVNEEIEGVASERRSVEAGERFDFVCECGQRTCDQTVPLTLEEYEKVRANPWRFITLVGHEVEGVEVVVESHPHYQVVEKTGPPREIAEQTDPRAAER